MNRIQSSIEARQPVAADLCPRGEGGPRRTAARHHAVDTAGTKIRAFGRRDLAPVTVDRLIRCCRLCARLRDDGREFISSWELGELLGCRPSLIRKDFSRLGRLGTRGHGYRIAGLIDVLKDLLGRGGPVTAVLVGTGSLGAALLARGDRALNGFRFIAAFDFDPSRAGTRCDGLVVNHVSRMSDVLGGAGVDVGVLAVSETKAQEAAQLLAENGVRAILNLTPAILSTPGDVAVTDIDFATELAKLAFHAASAQRRLWKDSATSGDRGGRAPAGISRHSEDLAGSLAVGPLGRDVLAAVGGTRQ